MKRTNVVLPAFLRVLLCLVTTVALRQSGKSRIGANEDAVWRKSVSQKPIVAGLSVAALGLALLVSVWSGSASAVKHRANLTEVSAQSANRLEAELLVVRADGFHPKEITRPPGRFLLALQNHSTAEDLWLVLRREGDSSMREVRTSKKQSKSRQFVDLPPGRYVLSEASHPDWSCTIIIRPN